jgi:hypothetical protein
MPRRGQVLKLEAYGMGDRFPTGYRVGVFVKKITCAKLRMDDSIQS